MATQQIEIRVLDKTQRALSNVSQRLSNLNKGLLGVNRVAGLAATALGAIGGANVVSNIVRTTARFEDLRTTLATVTGGAREGAQAFDFISKFSTQTQFGVEELTQTFIKLKASGIEPTSELLTLFTDAAAVTTDQLGSLQAITDLFSRTTAGGLGLEELNRLADRGIPVFDILQEKLGRNRLQLSDLGKTAEGANLILTALSDGIRERFGGATVNRINNVSTQFSNLQIAIANAADQIGSQGFAKALGQTAVEITNFIENNQQLVQEIGINLTKAFLFAKEAMVLVIANIDLLGKAFAAFFALKIATVVGSLAFAFGSTFVKGIVLATRAIKVMALAAAANPIIASGLAIAAGVEYLTGAFSELAEKMNIGGVADEALDALESGFEKVGEKIGANINGLEEFQNNISNINKKAQELAPKFEDVQIPADQIRTSAEKTNTAIGATNESLKEQANELAVTKKTFEEVLSDAEKQNALAGIATEQNKVIQEIKKAELSLGRGLTQKEREKLQTLFLQNEEYRKQAELQSKIESATQSLLSQTIQFAESEGKILEQANANAQRLLLDRFEKGEISYGQYLSSLINLEEAHAVRMFEINKSLEDRKMRYFQTTLEKRFQMQMRNSQYMEQFNKADFAGHIRRNEALQELVRERIEFEKKSELEKAQFGLEQATTLFTGLSKVNKKFFAAQKAAAIALAIVNTYQGATKALATYPPPFNFIAAAATVASGLAQVATIRAQTMQRGGALPAGQSAIVGEDGPELIVPKQPSTVIPREVADAIDNMGGRGGDPVVVNFNITTVDAESFDTLLIRRRGTITSIINGALQKRGKEGVV